MIRRTAWTLMVIALTAAPTAVALAQSYPDKPIKMVVPFPPGGPIDTMGRLVAHHLTASLGQQVVIDNRPGAGSTIGTKAVANADADGYTLLFGSSGSLAVAPALYSSFDVDPRKAFAAVATVALLPHVFVVAPSVPARTVAEFVAHAKANPGKLNYGAGLGTPPHLLSTLFKAKAGIDIVYVPYRGSAASITDLLGGQTQMTIDGLTGLYPLIRDGKVRPLAVARPERWPQLPEVPTLVESGFPDFVIDAWTGVVAPTGTPPEIIAKLNAAINEGLASEDAKVNLARFSAIAKIGTPQDFTAFLGDEMPKWADIVKLAGAKID
ncbi:MAG: Bug family tripartite tricarboxylate transporter substrate binding protein [Xanthobacteraceae bacterium]|jgi:tripartite-type tricarboxylate transporter receptor subunit TctC